MAYSKPERKKHKIKKNKLGLTRIDKDNPRRGIERGNAAQHSQMMKNVREQARTANNLERNKLKINKSNWLRYYGSREM